jgi:hypothetical protein
MKRHTLLFTYGLLTTTKRFRNTPTLTYETLEKPRHSTMKNSRVPTRPSSINLKNLEEKS